MTSGSSLTTVMCNDETDKPKIMGRICYPGKNYFNRLWGKIGKPTHSYTDAFHFTGQIIWALFDPAVAAQDQAGPYLDVSSSKLPITEAQSYISSQAMTGIRREMKSPHINNVD